MKIDRAPKHLGQFSLHGDELETGDIFWLELDEDVHIAPVGEILADHGSEERQAADVVASTECGDLAVMHLNPQAHDQECYRTTVQRDLPTRRKHYVTPSLR